MCHLPSDLELQCSCIPFFRNVLIGVGIENTTPPTTQAGWNFEQPHLLAGVPAYRWGLELDVLKGPFQTNPLYDSVIQFPHSDHQ